MTLTATPKIAPSPMKSQNGMSAIGQLDLGGEVHDQDVVDGASEVKVTSVVRKARSRK